MRDKKEKGINLHFISRIKRDGSGTEQMGDKDITYLDDTKFTMICLSITEGTYLACEFNSFVVKLKP